MPRLPTSRVRSFACLAAAVLLGACKDAPTGPEALRLAAGGREWLAIASPTDLPTASTWTPFLERQGSAGKQLADRVQHLETEADHSRVEGHFARATALRHQAEMLAVTALQSAPSPDVVLESAGAVDRWLQRVEGLDLSSHLLGTTVDSVRASRAAATASLAAGDTVQAVRHLMAASSQIRNWSPFEIAVRALHRAESGVAAMDEKGPARTRARHLALSARQELRRGDPLRALERALYAIQISGGAEVDASPTDPPEECGAGPC